MNMEALRHLALATAVSATAVSATAVSATALAALVALAPAPACAQGELERLGGGPGGVPSNPRGGSFFNERAGTPTRTRRKPVATPSPELSASPAPAAEDEASDEAPEIEWTGGLISVDCERVPAGDFLIEFNRQTGIPVRLEPGVTHRVTASFKSLRLERALAQLLPAGSWQLVRKPNTALRAADAYAGLVVHPPAAEGAAPAAYAKAKVGGMNFGPVFEVPGEQPQASQPVGGFAVDDGEPASASEPAPEAPASGSPAIAASTSATAPKDAAQKRIADLVEKKLKKKK